MKPELDAKINYWTLVFLLLGLSSTILFSLNIYYPVFLSVIFLGLVTIFFIINFYNSNIGILMPLMWLICALPFIHIIPYLWVPFDNSDLIQAWWGLQINPYMLDYEVIKLTGMIGATVGFGFAFGGSLLFREFKKNSLIKSFTKKQLTYYLSFGVWIAWIGFGIFFSWLAAPEKNVFNAVYTQSDSLIKIFNFSSAWTVSYVILIFGFCDAILDEDAYQKKWKILVFLCSISYVVVYLQLLRGDRESLTLVVGLAITYFYWFPKNNENHHSKYVFIKWFVAGIVLLIIQMLVGVMRSELYLVDSIDTLVAKFSLALDLGTLGFANIFRGTWTGVALTPLSVAGDQVYGLLPIKWGSDYWDLLASIIPGFLADAISYTRPIDAHHGPAWEMRYGIGGTHFSVMPFMNFRIIGVFVISTIFSYSLILLETKALEKSTVGSLASLCTVVMIAPHWFWYGEKNGMNAVIIFICISLIYKMIKQGK